jgi:hypothetical protein
MNSVYLSFGQMLVLTIGFFCLHSETKIPYKLEITTGKIRGSGTDANVFVQLFGDQGETAVVTLPAVKGSFESGKTDVFTIQAKNVGTVNKLRIGYTTCSPEFCVATFNINLIIFHFVAQAR